MSDEEVVRLLQAEEDAGASDHRSGGQSSSRQPTGSFRRPGTPHSPLQHVSADEELARRLQAEEDARAVDYEFDGHASSRQPPEPFRHGDSSAARHAQDMSYEELVKWLQEEEDASARDSGHDGHDQEQSLWKGFDRLKLHSPDKLPSTLAESNLLGQRDTARDERIIKSFAAQILTVQCLGCQKTLIPNDQAVGQLFQTFQSQKAGTVASSVISCQCGAKTCMGCGKAAQSAYCDSKCAKGAMFVVWVVLCGADALHAHSIMEDEDKKGSQRPTSTPQHHREQSQGVAKGTGYGGEPDDYGFITWQPLSAFSDDYGRPRPPPETSSEIALRARQARADADLKKILWTLREALHTSCSSLDEDEECLELLVALLLRSCVPDKLAELLRNDSIDDILKRQGLYTDVFSLVRVLTSHTSIATVVFDQRAVREKDLSLLEFCFDVSTNSGKAKQKVNVHPSLAHCIRNVGTQAATVLQNRHNLQGDDSHSIVAICTVIHEIATLLNNKDASSKQAVSSRSVADNAKAHEEWHREHCVEDVADDAIFIHYYFASEASRIQNMHNALNPRRMKKLMIDTATMKTSLPAGIFVRHANSRMDVMKVLIIGPKDTPYENGIFEFDMFCPISFPNDPPLVFFRGAGSLTTQINPNLHPNGKVCLSLLGTWPGDPWQPTQSTLYQVLVSIQSMIFCPEPFFNQPGLESAARCRDSDDYNREVRALTARFAILSWLEEHDPIWDAVVARHFSASAADILESVQRSGGPRALLPKLRIHLRTYLGGAGADAGEE